MQTRITFPAPWVSVIIPTLGRGSELRDCLESLWSQTEQDFEIIQVKEEGELPALRNRGAARAKGQIFIFIDDDVVADTGWLRAILGRFEDGSCSGVSGPAFIGKDYRKKRDIFRWPLLKTIYDFLFLGRQRNFPGRITKAGGWSTGACDANCKYEGSVDFLEACNMAFRADAFWSVGGFDESYRGIGDWSEPDLCFRLRAAGHRLWFSRDAKLEHRPSRTGAYAKRRGDSRNRMANYLLFSSRWVKPCWQHTAYKGFLRTYYWLKEKGWI